ncbi:MAG: FAD-dependent oxidoreductase [Candidatus Aminicenantes bacterium]|nr:FAD-dependent oxidoreductase [Candidatus Aminicenantes bacterium]
MSNTKRIIVIGGSAAGPKTAAKARRLDYDAEITIIQKARDLSMASCGYPYYVGGLFDDRNQLVSTPAGVVRDPKFFLNAKGINARTETEATAIDRKNRTIACRDLRAGTTEVLPYDKLVLCTGATPVIPPVPGKDLKGITTLQSMSDADYLRRVCDEGQIKKAVIIGGGLIGIETCEALELAGIEITVIELLPQLLTFLDWEMAKLVENHVRSRSANVITGNGLAEFLGENGRLTGVKLQNGTELPCELAVVAVGVRPNVKLAADAGLAVGALGGIVVDEHMKTSDPDIYAAGDCVECRHRITGKPAYSPMGDLANLQGRVAGENVVRGDTAAFPGTIQTGICKIFDYIAGTTGLSETAARKHGLTDIETVINANPDKPVFMGGKLIVSKMIVDRATRRLLGYQAVGPGDVSKQITAAAMAITAEMTVDDLLSLDFPYAPPFSPAIDHIITTAHIMQNKLEGRMRGISAGEVFRKLQGPDKPFLLDARGPDEYEASRLGLGETLIPLGALRRRLGELPADKGREIVCYCKLSLRGYEAATVLMANGWTDIKVMEGGLAAWPFPMEK